MQLKYQKRLTILIFILSGLIIDTSGLFAAESSGISESRKTGSVVFAAALEVQNQEVQNPDWLSEADRLMDELLALDAKIHTLITSVGNGDSRKALIRQRSINRKLIYDLAIARNAVLEGEK